MNKDQAKHLEHFFLEMFMEKRSLPYVDGNLPSNLKTCVKTTSMTLIKSF